jgi:outer membrane protein assembly factor BamB
LLKQKYPTEPYRALINRLLNSVDEVEALDHRVHTNGRLNLLRALTSADTRPFNDDFARRATVRGDVNRIRGSVLFATAEPGEPTHGNVAGATATLWWTWTAPAGAGRLALDTAGSEFDSVLAVYTGAALGTLRLLEANDNATAATTTSRLVVDVTPGTTYAIAVAGKPGGQGQLQLTLTTIPANDNFAAARTLVGPSVTVPANNAGATAEAGEPKPRNRRGAPLGLGRTVWFKWTAPQNRRYEFSVTDAAIDPVAAVYTGTTLDNLVEVASNDDSAAALFRFDSLVSFNAIAGVTYYLCVDVASGPGGSFNVSVSDADWQALTFLPVYASPALAPDGTVYVLDSAAILAAFAPSGLDLWAWIPEFDFDAVFGGSVAVGPDGTLYFGTYYGDLHAVDAKGDSKWRFTTDNEIWTAPALGADGTIYVKSADDYLYALSPDGKLKWKVSVPGDTYSSPVIGADGTIYVVAGGDTALYALNPDGSRKWRAELGATAYASPAIGADGTLYLGNYDGRFFAIRPDGTERWRFDSGSPLSGSPAIDARGVVYFGSYDKKLYALDAATGAKRWDYATGDIIRGTCPVIADDGAIYIGSDDGFIHAVEPDGKLRRTFATGGPIFGSPILHAGRLYVVSSDAKLHAFEVGANLARSPWPMHRHNVRRTGRVIDPLPGLPTISTQPVATSASAGAAATFRVAAQLPDSGTLSYQWRVDGRAIAGATAATFTLPSAQTSDVGDYSVIVTGPGGSILSRAVALTVTGAANTNARLSNLAVRTLAGPGDDVLLVGFVVGGAGTSGNKPLLLRAVGPTLGAFGVEGALADPKLELFASGATTPLAVNDDWAGAPAIATLAPQLGAFALASTTSKDSALLSTRAAGAFTVQISAATGARGVALAEIYDATPSAAFTAATPRLINVSARTRVGTGGDVLIAGFAVSGTGSRQILVRAVGPTLGVFGVTGFLANPKLDLFASGNTTALSSNDDWAASANAAQVAAAAARIGAFALPLESRDAALLLTLPPGSYTAQISGVNSTTGHALVEVYEVP